jgi:hypothetical protein
MKMPVYHTRGGSEPCGQIAFYFLDHELSYGQYCDEIVKLDGTHPKHRELMCCGHCGQLVCIQNQSRPDGFFISALSRDS